MQSMRSLSAVPVALTLALALLAPLRTASAATYANNTCVAAKQRATGSFCRAALNAWKLWERSQNDTTRDAAIARAANTLATTWASTEKTASRQNVDCAGTTASAVDMQTQIATAVAAIAADVNTGLTLVTKSNVTCGAAVLGAAANDCGALLGAEAGYVARLSAGKARRDQAETSARGRFQNAFTRATTANCPTAATATTLQSSIDALAAGAVTSTTVSPNVDNTQFITVAPTGTVTYQRRGLTPLCSRGTPYYFFAKRGTVNKLVMYYEGGGACWDYLTCNIGTFNQSINPTGSDNPQNQQAGFGDLSNPNNPFKDWNIVFTSYCTGDIHFGDAHQDYVDPTNSNNVTHVDHFGYQNARVVEKWAREHFVNPDEVFVTGSSAGAYGALFNAPLLEDVWPDSKFSVLADAGNGVTTASFIENNFASWNFVKNTPNKIPGVLQAIQTGTGIPAYLQAVTAFYPNTTWANYATAYDGGTGGQTGFYNVMLSLFKDWPKWWQETCAWHGLMVQQAQDTVAAVTTDNYRYYIGRGSRHTGWGSNTVVYNDDAIGETPALKDWVTSMRNRDAGWVNVECTNCETTLPGDPVPSPLQAPFQQVGSDVDIVCP